MKVRKAFKYRICPTKEQQAKLEVQFGHNRFVYNWGLNARQTAYQENGKGLYYSDLAQMLTLIKKFSPVDWLKEADSQTLQQTLKDLDRAFANFFEGRADYPNFKSKRSPQSIRYPQRFKVDGSRIYLPKVGKVRAVFHRPIEGKMKNATVSKTPSGKYFVSIQCEVEIQDPVLGGPTLGIDLGLKHFAVLSTGEKVDHPQYFRKTEKKLARLQRQLSRKEKGSASWEKARIKVAQQHEKVANQRQDFLHKLSRRLVGQFGHIKIENLNVQGMVKNHTLAKSISDSGWGMFGQFLAYKGQRYGSEVEKIDRFFPSSKLCHVCALVNGNLKLYHRFWTCEGCGTEHDRDRNAAINIKMYRVGATRINASGVQPVGVTPKIEAHPL
jgi:putative transposase